MSYDRAEEILPEDLIRAIQQYVSGKSIYIPCREKKSWGSQTKTRQYYQKRNEEIRRKYAGGIAVKFLAEEYSLSEKSIQRILRAGALPIKEMHSDRSVREGGGREMDMKTQEEYLQGLRRWLRDTEDEPLEEMASFFEKRLDDYEERMSVWEKSYRLVAQSIPGECRKILDLGCGTGLELDQIWKTNPDVAVTGVDLCRAMLDKLLAKHPDKRFAAVCQDYFDYDPGREQWDAVISFESLHHFLPERKRELYQKIYHSVKVGGVFILGDYIACCDEEEELLRDVYLRRRKQSVIPEDRFVHFDIPLTMEHEMGLLRSVGFQIENVMDEDAAVIVCRRKEAG